MATTKLSILGLYNWDDGLFDQMVVPAGVNRDDLISSIFQETAGFDLVFRDWDYMHDQLGVWSRKLLPKWTRLAELWGIIGTYNPIENYDRYEDETGKGQHSDLDVRRDHRLVNGSSNATRGGTNTEAQAAYNDTDLKTVQRSTFDDHSDTLGTTTEQDNGNLNRSGDESHERHLRVHGNIGVTTSAQMLESERKLADWDLIDVIVQDFIGEFCVAVY